MGVISPKIRIRTVRITVTMLTIYPPKLYASVVAREEAEMFTMLFPMRIALRSLGVWFSRISRAMAARLFPSSARERRRILFTDISAVSLDEKKADNASRISNMIIW